MLSSLTQHSFASHPIHFYFFAKRIPLMIKEKFLIGIVQLCFELSLSQYHWMCSSILFTCVSLALVEGMQALEHELY